MLQQRPPHTTGSSPLGNLLLRVGMVVFTTELLIMLALLFSGTDMTLWSLSLMDAAILTGVAGVVLHYWITKPLNQQLSGMMEHLQETRLAAERLAQTDSLTGVLNRRAFFDRFEQEWLKSERTDVPLSFLLLDIDFFKSVNDTHGHRAGDAVLKQVAQLIQSTCRSYDDVGRYGGEEFCILMTNTTLSAAVDVAERLRTTIATAMTRHDGHSLAVTASIGVSQRGLNTPGLIALMDAADQSLFEAKRSGRNRVCATPACDTELPAALEPANV